MLKQQSPRVSLYPRDKLNSKTLSNRRKKRSNPMRRKKRPNSMRRKKKTANKNLKLRRSRETKPRVHLKGAMIKGREKEERSIQDIDLKTKNRSSLLTSIKHKKRNWNFFDKLDIAL